MSDCDVEDSKEINSLFPPCKHISEIPLCNKKNYILHISSTTDSTPNVAVGLTNNNCEIINLSNNQLGKLISLDNCNKESLVGVKFCPTDNNLLYTGHNKSIKVWDLRKPEKSIITFVDSTNQNNTNKTKTFSCFDVSPNNRLLTVGTNLFEADSFILFWDIRKNNFLGGYWESHSDEITQLKFHKDDSNRLISGSTDGLINIFDVSKNCEDDALIDTLNSESSVEKIEWIDNGIFCLTHSYDLYFWIMEQPSPYLKATRSDIAYELERNTINSYVVNVHNSKNGNFLLAGSNYDCLRTLNIVDNKHLKPGKCFLRNKQIVRCSWFNQNINLLFTGGEKGLLNAWEV